MRSPAIFLLSLIVAITTSFSIDEQWDPVVWDCGPFPGETEASVGDLPIAIYLGPSQLTAARYTESNEAVLIAKVEANEPWRHYITRAAAEGIESSLGEDSEAPYLATTFLPTLSQIIEAVTANLKLTVSEITLGPILLSLNTIPARWDITLPVIKYYGSFGFLFYLKSIRAAALAYNLTIPGGDRDYQYLNPSVWPGRQTISHSMLEYDDDKDAGFMLYVNFEPSFLHLSLIALEDLAVAPRASKILASAGSDNLFTSPTTSLPISSEEGVRTLMALITEFVANHTAAEQRGGLLAVILAGGADERGLEVMRTALSKLSMVGEVLGQSKLMTEIDPAYVSALGGANWVVQREMLIRRDLRLKKEQELRGHTKL